eukprot:7262348-Prymnesium_polylepis.1
MAGLKWAPDVDENVATAVATAAAVTAAVATGLSSDAPPAAPPVTMSAVPTASCRKRVGSRSSAVSLGRLGAAGASAVGCLLYTSPSPRDAHES